MPEIRVPIERVYQMKPCEKCERLFQPSGPRSTECKRENCASATAALHAAIERNTSSNGETPTITEDLPDAPKPKRKRPAAKAKAARSVRRPVKRSVKRTKVVVRPRRAKPSIGLTSVGPVLGLIEQFGLDYYLGTAVCRVLERDDGDEIENLMDARFYLDRAIELRQAEANA